MWPLLLLLQWHLIFLWRPCESSLRVARSCWGELDGRKAPQPLTGLWRDFPTSRRVVGKDFASVATGPAGWGDLPEKMLSFHRRPFEARPLLAVTTNLLSVFSLRLFSLSTFSSASLHTCLKAAQWSFWWTSYLKSTQYLLNMFFWAFGVWRCLKVLMSGVWCLYSQQMSGCN